MATIIKDDNLTRVAESVKPDFKRRVHLPKGLGIDGVTFHIYTNSFGQIVLDPQVTIPASELWVFKNDDILASIDRGMVESINGKAINRGSFAKYVKDEP